MMSREDIPWLIGIIIGVILLTILFLWLDSVALDFGASNAAAHLPTFYYLLFFVAEVFLAVGTVVVIGGGTIFILLVIFG